jgi:hypothetical protein
MVTQRNSPSDPSVPLSSWFEVLQSLRGALADDLVNETRGHVGHSLDLLPNFRLWFCHLFVPNPFAFFLNRAPNSFLLPWSDSSVARLFLLIPDRAHASWSLG